MFLFSVVVDGMGRGRGGLGWTGVCVRLSASGGRPPANEVADQLDDLDDDDDRDDRGDHDVVLPAVVAVVDGHLAQAAAADGARHRGVADEGDRQGRDRLDEGGHGLADEDSPTDLPVGGAHHLGGLDLARVDGQEVRLHEAREEGRGEDDERHDGGQRARGLADNHLGDRDQHDDADDEGQGAHDVNDEGDGLVHALVGGEAALAGLDQHEAQERSDDDRENGGQARHHEGLEIAGTNFWVRAGLSSHVGSPLPVGASTPAALAAAR